MYSNSIVQRNTIMLFFICAAEFIKKLFSSALDIITLFSVRASRDEKRWEQPDLSSDRDIKAGKSDFIQAVNKNAEEFQIKDIYVGTKKDKAILNVDLTAVTAPDDERTVLSYIYTQPRFAHRFTLGYDFKPYFDSSAPFFKNMTGVIDGVLSKYGINASLCDKKIRLRVKYAPHYMAYSALSDVYNKLAKTMKRQETKLRQLLNDCHADIAITDNIKKFAKSDNYSPAMLLICRTEAAREKADEVGLLSYVREEIEFVSEKLGVTDILKNIEYREIVWESLSGKQRTLLRLDNNFLFER